MDAPQQHIQQQLSLNHSMVDENHPIMEGIPELTINTHVSELMVLCEMIVYFKNLKDNRFDFSKTLELQGWKNLFERMIGSAYPVLVKKF